jgi:hypothetical protein
VTLPTVELEPVAEEHKSVLANLVQLYRYDFSEVRGYELSGHGTFVYRFLDHYWTEPGRSALFIRQKGQLAGFALSRQRQDGVREVAEFLVVRAHRRSGVGRAAALGLFERTPGEVGGVPRRCEHCGGAILGERYRRGGARRLSA